MKRVGFISLSILISVFLNAQKPVITLEVSPKNALVNEELTITIKSNIQGNIDIQFPKGFVQGYNVMNGMEQSIDYTSGKSVTFNYQTQTGKITKPGTYQIGPAIIRRGMKIYRSNLVEVNIKKSIPKQPNKSIDSPITSNNFKKIAFGVIECSKSFVYEGEPVLLNAKVYARFEPTHLENYEPYTFVGAVEKYELDGQKSIQIHEEYIKGQAFYTFSYDKKLFFPSGSGTLQVDPFQLMLSRGFESMPIESNSLQIRVKPLPKAPANFTGGVGKMKIEGKLNENVHQINQGDVFELNLTVTGQGNLQNLSVPTLYLPKEFELYGDPTIQEDYQFNQQGAEGSIIFLYHIRAIQTGKLEIPRIKMAYFNPETEKFEYTETSKMMLHVKGNSKDVRTYDNQFQPKLNQLSETTSNHRKSNENAVKSVTSMDFRTWLILILSLIILLLLGRIFYTRSKVASSNTTGFEKQTNTSMKPIKKPNINELLLPAKKAISSGDNRSFFDQLHQGVLSGISLFLKQDDSTGILKKEDAIKELISHHVETTYIDDFISIISICEHARYGLGETDHDPQELITKSEHFLQAIFNFSKKLQ